jgi:acetyl-CoA C-acetyltransferase
VILRALVERTKLDPERIDDVSSRRATATARRPASAAGRAGGRPADQRPGLSARPALRLGPAGVIDAAMMVQTGAADVVIAGGVESMSKVEYYSLDMRNGARAGSVTMHDRLARGRVMSQPIEPLRRDQRHDRDRRQLARDYGITREQADAYAARSQQRGAKAWADGKFADELVPVSVPQKQGRSGGLRPRTRACAATTTANRSAS